MIWNPRILAQIERYKAMIRLGLDLEACKRVDPLIVDVPWFHVTGADVPGIVPPYVPGVYVRSGGDA